MLSIDNEISAKNELRNRLKLKSLDISRENAAIALEGNRRNLEK